MVLFNYITLLSSIQEKIWELSKRLTPRQFNKLTSELEIELEQKNEITAEHCTNSEDVQNARVEILKSWWDNQDSSREAYVLMGEALIQAGLKLIAKEVWGYVPAEQSSKRSSDDLDTSCHKRMRTEPPMVNDARC